MVWMAGSVDGGSQGCAHYRSLESSVPLVLKSFS